MRQIGDGDILAVRTGGRALVPLPPDPSNRGRYLEPVPGGSAPSFRVAALDLERQLPRWLMLATDGYGNAQVADPWYQRLAGDLLARRPRTAPPG